MKRTIETARNPVRRRPQMIDLFVKFRELDEEVPFTAAPDDIYDHGRDLYARAESGEFGDVINDLIVEAE